MISSVTTRSFGMAAAPWPRSPARRSRISGTTKRGLVTIASAIPRRGARICSTYCQNRAITGSTATVTTVMITISDSMLEADAFTALDLAERATLRDFSTRVAASP